ncbi:MAG: TraR/DksA family transcriptional regulator [Acidimicrobiales bacterium]
MEQSHQPGPPEPHPEDPGDLAAARAMAVGEYRSRLASAGRVLDDVDRALSALEDGTYGRCAECGTPIDDATLAAEPTTLCCPRHQRPDAAAGERIGPTADDGAGERPPG